MMQKNPKVKYHFQTGGFDMLQVAGYIERKSMLYKTGVEYGDYTINHVMGCAHGCNYPCYAFLMKRRFGQVESYDDWCKPYLVSNALELLDKEIPKLRHKINYVQLCFTTDPFMYGYDEIHDMSIRIIKKLNNAGIKCVVLTKGILPMELSGLSEENEYGITLISLDEQFRKRMEPGAAPYKDRLDALRRLSDKGCKTWISMEPYPTPNLINQDLYSILNEVSFTDKIIFGRANYNKVVNSYKMHREFYNEKAEEVLQFCENNNIEYYIKDKTITETVYENVG